MLSESFCQKPPGRHCLYAVQHLHSAYMIRPRDFVELVFESIFDYLEN